MQPPALLVALSACAAQTGATEQHQAAFSKFIKTYNKTYSSTAEKEMRLRLFSAERERVMKTPSPDYTNPLFDRTLEEKNAMLAGNCAPTDNADDCAALSALAYATNFAQWTDNANWMLGSTYCNWNGIRCEDGGRVAAIKLAHNHVVGSLPSQLSQLTQLQDLDLGHGGNDLSAQPEGFPVVVTQMSRLVTLDFGGCNMHGAIPSTLWSLKNMAFLALSNNNWDPWSIPDDVSNMVALNSVNFANSSLRAISDRFCKIPGFDFTESGKECHFKGGSNQFSCPLPYCVFADPHSDTVCDATCS